MKTGRNLLLSCLLAVALANAALALQPRQSDLSLTVPTTGGSETTTTGGTTTTQQQTTTTSTSTTSTTTEKSTTAQSTATTTTDKQTSQQQPTNTATTTTNAPPPNTSKVVTTNSQGEDVTITITNTNAATDTSASASSTASSGSSSSDNNDTGLGTGSIVGIAVAGGVAVLGVIAFVIWKFTRKRFNDFDDSEAIQWPELNAHGGAGADTHPLPTHSTGRAGFDTDSQVSLSRAPSQTGTNYSTPDLGAHNDPYAVPPLPHLNPGQPLPYHDDPNAVGAYYDPYRGPVPNTFEQGAGGEVYPMTQMGRASPGPGAALAYPETGRASPSLAGRASPGPQAAYGGRSSPGPQAAYGMGMGRTTSPGPQMAYGRSSPGPQAAYDAYGGAR